MTGYDAIVVGAGHNGLVAAVRLASAGWRVLALERAARPGGALRSAELTAAGLAHDVFATNCNGFRASPFFADHADELAGLGVRWATSDRPVASAFPDGSALTVLQGLDRTLAALPPEDREGWRALDARFERLSPLIYDLYRSPRPGRGTVHRTLGLAGRLAAAGTASAALARLASSSTRRLVERLATPEAQATIAAWPLHADFGPQVRGGAPLALLQTFSCQRSGIAVVEGGASRLVDGLVAMLRARGGELRTAADVVAVETDGRRATGVTLAGGERIGARRAVVASVTPGALAGLLDAPPRRMRRRARRFRHGPGTMMVHLALDGAVPWRAADELRSAAYVHIGPYVEDMEAAYRAAVDGVLPSEPLLVVGQTSVVDPTRAGAGGEQALWVQVRPLPARPVADERGEIGPLDGGWDAIGPAYAERVLDKLEAYAPGLRSRIRGMAVLTPADLERADPNLVGGDSLGGSMHLDQGWLLRPGPRTAVRGLWLTGSSTWPGAGVNGLAGEHAAAAVLAAPPG